ncbi:hypothetical protein ACSBR2_039893 [Camellia fascicularis]
MNHDGKTPMMVFEEDHRRMIQSQQQWIVNMASACIVSTTIIGTLAFSAAIQVPGETMVKATQSYIREPTSQYLPYQMQLLYTRLSPYS